MSSTKRKESWLRHDAKRKKTANRQYRERARAKVRQHKIPKSNICCLCFKAGSTVLHHESYEPVFLLELCTKCHRAKHPRPTPIRYFRGGSRVGKKQ